MFVLIYSPIVSSSINLVFLLSFLSLFILLLFFFFFSSSFLFLSFFSLLHSLLFTLKLGMGPLNKRIKRIRTHTGILSQWIRMNQWIYHSYQLRTSHISFIFNCSKWSSHKNWNWMRCGCIQSKNGFVHPLIENPSGVAFNKSEKSKKIKSRMYIPKKRSDKSRIKKNEQTINSWKESERAQH